MSRNLFNSIKLPGIKSNVFDLSHDVKLSLDFGNLTPICVQECVPGDKFNISCESLLRFSPLVSPVMHRMDVTMHYFFVPNRIIWDGWEDFITGNKILSDTTPAFPYFTILPSDIPIKSLGDYLGLPSGSDAALNPQNISALPFAAYQAIYHEYYRDQNLIGEFDYKLQNGDNTPNFGTWSPLRKRAWEHDYFTSALPWAQKGPAVDIPLGDVMLKDGLAADETGRWVTPDTSTNAQTGGLQAVTVGGGASQSGTVSSADVLEELTYDPNGTLETGATSINDLRRAFRLQEWLERNARAGTRYIENILGHFGVKSSDKRLNRPEYITGTKSPVQISEVLNTTGETSGLPQGNMAGHGVSVTSGKYGRYYCEEHGYIIGIMSVMPKPAYQQGIPRHFLKNDRLLYFWPSFAHLGEQEILNKELYWGDDELNEDVFGYTPRYSEYKYAPNRVAGDFRDTLDFWHFGRIFGSRPTLSQQFVECDPGKRIFAVESETENSLYAHVYNKIRAVRKMPKYGTPLF